MLKKPAKAIKFYYDIHDNTPLNKGATHPCTPLKRGIMTTPPLPPLIRGKYQNVPSNKGTTTPEFPPNKGGLRGVWCILQKGWLAKLKGYKVSLVGLFHHICLTN